MKTLAGDHVDDQMVQTQATPKCAVARLSQRRSSSEKNGQHRRQIGLNCFKARIVIHRRRHETTSNTAANHSSRVPKEPAKAGRYTIDSGETTHKHRQRTHPEKRTHKDGVCFYHQKNAVGTRQRTAKTPFCLGPEIRHSQTRRHRCRNLYPSKNICW
jgi:hypothetical protein